MSALKVESEYFDHEELTHEQIQSRSIRGGIMLTVRRALLKLVALLAFIVLGWLLEPAEFGVFAIVSFIVSFFAYFSDVGLAAALIQKKDRLTITDIRTTFTIQQILVFSITLILVSAAPFIISRFYADQLETSAGLLVQALGLSLILASLKSVPSALLERRLQFDKLVLPEIVETLLYNGLTVLLAWQGFGVWSFIIAMLARGIVGTILIYILCPWPIGFAFNKHSAKKLFSFGVPFQLNSFIALIKDNVVPTFVAGYLGPAAVGNINWAQKYAFLPLEILNDIIRVTFPAYSRLQHDTQLLRKALERSLYLISLLLFPMIAGLLALMPLITLYILNPKWLPALPVFYLLSINTMWATISTTFTNALFAVGKSAIVLRYMIIWTILTWILVPFFTFLFQDIRGLGFAQALIACTSLGLILEVRRVVHVSILPQIWTNAVAAILMGLILFVTAPLYVNHLLTLIMHIIFGVILYASFILLFSKKRVLAEYRSLLSKIKSAK